MAQYLLLSLAACFLAVCVTPLIKRLAVRLGWIDRPAARKMHTRPMPLMGGMVIYLAFIASLILFGERAHIREAVGIFGGASLCSFMGLWDDRRSLGATVKLLGQFAAAVVLILSGVRVQLPAPLAVNLFLTALWVVGITNAMNLLDNMDGLAGGVSVAASAFFLLMAAMNHQVLVGALAASLLGASIGFMVYNVNPASIFMGDSGSLFIGFMLAAVGIKLRFPENVNIVTWMAPVLVLGLPILDTSLVFVSRLRRHLNPLTTPGKDHLSHRLVKLGYTPREAVLTIHLVCVSLGVIAMYVTQATVAEGYLLGGLVAVAAIVAIIWLERVAPVGLNAVAPTVPPPAAPGDGDTLTN